MWLSKDVLSWKSEQQGYRSHPYSDACARTYEIWEHAERLLLNKCNSFQLIDALSTLKRAINHRLQKIDSLYPIRQLFPDQNHNKRFLQQLACLGLVRPVMLEKLIEIRNSVEHSDREPPDQIRCMEFLDLVWYFLRSTDRLVINIITDFELIKYDKIGDERSNFINIEVPTDLSKLCFKLSGIVPKGTIIPFIPNSMKLPFALQDSLEIRGECNESDNERMSFKGKLSGPLEEIRDIYKLYFSVW